MRTIDAHLHAWSDDKAKYPFVPPHSRPGLPGGVTFLLGCMEDPGVSGCLIIQPIAHRFDHRYVTDALRAHTDKFKGCVSSTRRTRTPWCG